MSHVGPEGAVSLNRRVATLRLVIAAYAGLMALVPFMFWSWRHGAASLIPVAMPIVGAVAIFIPRLSAQLLARAAWWSVFVLGVMRVAMVRDYCWDHSRFLVLGPGVALLAAGRVNVPQALENSRYNPVAFQSTLLGLMILSLANASLFLYVGLNQSRLSGKIVFAASSAIVLIGFASMWRLRIWGAWLNVLLCASLVGGAVFGIVWVRQGFRDVVRFVNALYLIVASPMLVSHVLKKPLPAVSQRKLAWGAGGFIVLLMVISMAVHPDAECE